jgi:polo-like kinase 1
MKHKKILNEEETRHFMHQIISALQYLHNDKKIIHRDLKLGNLFVNKNMDIKMGDFGLATQIDFDGERKKTICGTPNYIAPEVLNSDGHSYEVDIWSLGVLMYTFIVGIPPFETKEVKSTYKKIKNNDYQFPPNIKISDDAKEVIIKMLSSDPNSRPKINDILEFEFFKKKGECPKSLIEYSEFYISTNRESTTTKSINENKKMRIEKPIPFRTLENDNVKEEKKEKLKKETKLEEYPNIVQVTKYIDYSNKYGLAYKLSNGYIGAFYNDSTKIILNPNTKEVAYYDRIREKDYTYDKKILFNLSNYPEEHSKKVKLIVHFEKNLNSESLIKSPVKEGDVYIKKWSVINNCFLFKFNNNSYQLIFNDGFELYMNDEDKSLVFKNNGIKEVYDYEEIKTSNNKEFLKRLNLFDDILLTLNK